MLLRTVLLLTAIAVLSPPSVAAAASPTRMGIPPNLRFEAAPKIGERVPDLTIFDERGNPVNLREVAREHYTVLVLGCLT